jgi:hypothetical protein
MQNRETANVKLMIEKRLPEKGTLKYLEPVFTPPLGGWRVINSPSNRFRVSTKPVDL